MVAGATLVSKAMGTAIATMPLVTLALRRVPVLVMSEGS
jgi:hypothetical protein